MKLDMRSFQILQVPAWDSRFHFFSVITTFSRDPLRTEKPLIALQKTSDC